MTQVGAVAQYDIRQLLVNNPLDAATKETGYICEKEFKNKRNCDVRIQTAAS